MYEVGYELQRNWVTSYESYKSAAAKLILNWWGQGGDSVAGKIKGRFYREYKKRNAGAEQGEPTKKHPSPSPGSSGGGDFVRS